jgi:uncharacterized protein (UPF0262 family)
MSKAVNICFDKISSIELDEGSFIKRSEVIEMERNIAIADLLKENFFAPVLKTDEKPKGPYKLELSVDGDGLIIYVIGCDDQPFRRFQISLNPFRTIVKEYFLICESYFKALKGASPNKIEAIDMGRRSIHNEGASLLKERLKSKCDMDNDTSRRLFTLICVLHIRA